MKKLMLVVMLFALILSGCSSHVQDQVPETYYEDVVYPGGKVETISYYDTDFSNALDRTIINTDKYSIVVRGIHTVQIGVMVEFVDTVNSEGEYITNLRIVGKEIVWEVIR